MNPCLKRKVVVFSVHCLLSLPRLAYLANPRKRLAVVTVTVQIVHRMDTDMVVGVMDMAMCMGASSVATNAAGVWIKVSVSSTIRFEKVQ